MTQQEFHRLVNDRFYKAYKKLPTAMIPTDESLVSDMSLRKALFILINENLSELSTYIPKYQWVGSPVKGDNSIIPMIPKFETTKMFMNKKDLKNGKT